VIILLGSLIAVPLVTGLLVLLLPRGPKYLGALLLLPAAAVFAMALRVWTLAPESGTPDLFPLPWFSSLPFDASLRLDSLAALFVVLIGGIGLGVVQYSRHYFKSDPGRLYWGCLFVFMSAMLGFVLSDSLLLAFVFWELTTLTSALLIGLRPDVYESRRGALQAFLLTGFGGLCLLTGILLIGVTTGAYSFSGLAAISDQIGTHPAHTWALLLMCAGAFTKSAQFPFHFWLPGAMSAPAPISAYLHSATLVNAGVFLLARLAPAFSLHPLWHPLLSTVGVTTFAVGAWFAYRSLDLKELLAYSTVSYLGVLTALYAGAGEEPQKGELLHFTNHALYKSAMFLLLGWFEKLAGTRDISKLDDEYWLPRRPFAGILFLIGATAMAGGPFLLAYQSKKIFYENVIEAASTPMLLSILAFVGSVLSVGAALKFSVSPLMGSRKPYEAGKAPVWLLIIPTLLLVPQLVGGLLPEWFLTTLEPSSEWPGGISFWTKLDLDTLMTVAVFALGGVCFIFWRRLTRKRISPMSERLSDALTYWTLAAAKRTGTILQAGSYSHYVAVCVSLLTGFALFAVLAMRPPALSWIAPDASGWLAFAPAFVTVSGALGAIFSKRRITKLIMLAFSGYALAVFFVLYRAPDLALTQILVESVLLFFLLLAFRNLPDLQKDTRSFTQKGLHLTVAAFSGVCVAMLVLWANLNPVARTTEALSELSAGEAQGLNVVNVILVDFRGADTFGEIVVLAIAALGVVCLLRARNAAKESL